MLKEHRLIFQILCLVLCLTPTMLHSQTLSGVVRNQNKEPLPFASVYRQKSSIGTTTNFQGAYSLSLPAGVHIIEFRLIGHKTRIDTITLPAHEHRTLNVRLTEQVSNLQEVEIKEVEDPAVAMMKQAIARRKINSTLPERGTYEAFAKGLVRYVDVILPQKILNKPVAEGETHMLDSLKEHYQRNDGIMYMAESQTINSWQLPDSYKEEMIACRQSGDSNRYNQLFTQSGNIDFYTDLVNVPISSKKFHSLLCDQALAHYRFFLMDSLVDPSLGKIYKIKTVPRNISGNVFSGYIYLQDSSWRIKDIDLCITRHNKIPWVDSIHIQQNYLAVDQSQWMLGQTHLKFFIRFNVLGIKMFFQGDFLIHRRNYDFAPQFPHGFFKKEILLILPDANKKDSTYWQQTPIVQTPFEQAHYKEADSIYRSENDSLALRKDDSISNRFNFINLISSYTYHNRAKNYRWSFTSPLSDISFNTVQGWVVNLGSRWHKTYNRNNNLLLSAKASYGFSDYKPRFQTAGTWNYNVDYLARFSWEADWNNAVAFEPLAITDFANDVHSLLFSKNRKKIFSKTALMLEHSIEIYNGFVFTTGLSYQQRQSLINHSDQKIVTAWRIPYTSNDPQHPRGDNLPAFPTHQTAILSAQLQWTPFQSYALLPYKHRFGSKYPVVSLDYRGSLASSPSFSFIQATLTYNCPMKQFGSADLMLRAGTFLQKPLYFIDYKHYKGNRSIFFLGDLDHFRALPLYDHSTASAFLEGHYRLQSSRWLFSRLPLIKRTEWVEEFEIHTLLNERQNPYIECSFGVSNIAKFFALYFSLGLQHQMSPVYNVTLSFKTIF